MRKKKKEDEGARLVLCGGKGKITFEDSVAFHEKLTGKTLSPEELEDARKTWDALGEEMKRRKEGGKEAKGDTK